MNVNPVICRQNLLKLKDRHFLMSPIGILFYHLSLLSRFKLWIPFRFSYDYLSSISCNTKKHL